MHGDSSQLEGDLQTVAVRGKGPGLLADRHYNKGAAFTDASEMNSAFMVCCRPGR